MGKIIYIDRCPRCNGKGKVKAQEMKDARIYVVDTPCQYCDGRGMIRRRDHDGRYTPGSALKRLRP